MSGLELGALVAVVGAGKWIVDTLGDNHETQQLIKKLQRLETKYSKMDKRTKESEKIMIQLVQVKTLIQAKQGGAASRAVDGILAVAGL
jgi:hypothetical protein